jgi:hypothetical protein
VAPAWATVSISPLAPSEYVCARIRIAWVLTTPFVFRILAARRQFRDAMPMLAQQGNRIDRSRQCASTESNKWVSAGSGERKGAPAG